MADVQKKNDANNQYTLKGGNRTKTSSSAWLYIPGREVYRDYQPGYRLKLSRRCRRQLASCTLPFNGFQVYEVAMW
jgi:hypothetical protein